MKKKLFGNNIECNCEYCNNWIYEDEEYLCRLEKQIDENGNCKKFSYDPLKRAPYRKPNLPEYDPNEFKL